MVPLQQQWPHGRADERHAPSAAGTLSAKMEMACPKRSTTESGHATQSPLLPRAPTLPGRSLEPPGYFSALEVTTALRSTALQ